MQVTGNMDQEDWEIAVLHAKKMDDDYWIRDCLIGAEMELSITKFGGVDFESDSSNNSDLFISNQDTDDTDGVVLGIDMIR
jgi:hypothetical protein